MLEAINLDEEDEAAEDAPAPKPVPFDIYGDELPSGKRATVVGFDGAAKHAFEEAITSGNPVVQGQAWGNLLLACLTSYDGKEKRQITKGVVNGIFNEDAEALYIRIGMLSFPSRGKLFKADWTCAPPFVKGGCGEKHKEADRVWQTIGIDVSRVTFTPLVAPRPVTLPGVGKVLTVKPSTIGNQERYLQRKKAEHGVDWIRLLLSRDAQLDGEIASEEVLEKLLAEDVEEAKRALETRGGLDCRVTATCRFCGKKWTLPVWLVPGFFSGRRAKG